MNDRGVLGGDDCLPLGPAKKIEPAPAQQPRRGAPATPPPFVVGPDGKMRTNGYVPKLEQATFAAALPPGTGAVLRILPLWEGSAVLACENGVWIADRGVFEKADVSPARPAQA